MNIKEFLSEKYWAARLNKLSYTKRKMIEDTMILQTPFLPYNVSIRQRGWHIINDINSIPTCPMCSNLIKFKNDNSYGKYCSVKCAASDPEVIKKKLQTDIANHGDKENYRKHKAEQLKQLSLKKYGVINVFQAKEIKDKSKNSLIKNHGVDHPAKSKDIMQKIKITMNGRYGVNHAHQSKELRQKFTDTMNKRYGVDHALQSDYILESIKKDNNTKFKRNHHTQILISAESMDKLNDTEWLKTQNHVLKRTIDSIAEELNVDHTTISRYFKNHGIELKRHANSLPERDLTKLLEQHNIKVITNSRDIITPYELDIYIPDKNIAIEYCGLYWHSENNGKDKHYHKIKYELCKQKGIRLIQIFEDEWIENRKLVENKLLHILGISQEQKIYARKCEIKTLTQHEKQEFFNETHIQGDGQSSCNYGLFYENNLVAAIGFIKQQNNEYILNRYSTNANVIGGFTKLLNHFERTLKPFKIITFADLRWSQGNLYEKSGFSLDKILKPDYFWVNEKSRFHKFNFRHIGMKTKLKNYDPTLSETKNMHNNNWWKIYDAGKLKYIKK